MAKVYRAPTQVGEPPDLTIGDIQGYMAREQEWVQAVGAWAKANGSGALAGEEVRWPHADGQARYVVYTEKPLALIHLPVGDAWQFPYVNAMRLSDIRQQVERQRGLARLFGRKS